MDKDWDRVEDAYAAILAGDIDEAKHQLERCLSHSRQVQALNHSKHIKSMMDLRERQKAENTAKSRVAA